MIWFLPRHFTHRLVIIPRKQKLTVNISSHLKPTERHTQLYKPPTMKCLNAAGKFQSQWRFNKLAQSTVIHSNPYFQRWLASAPQVSAWRVNQVCVLGIIVGPVVGEHLGRVGSENIDQPSVHHGKPACERVRVRETIIIIDYLWSPISYEPRAFTKT